MVRHCMFLLDVDYQQNHQEVESLMVTPMNQPPLAGWFFHACYRCGWLMAFYYLAIFSNSTSSPESTSFSKETATTTDTIVIMGIIA